MVDLEQTLVPEGLNIERILDILPHRYPFLLIDRIVEINTKEGYIRGIKNVTINEQFFNGHFPGKPIMPGVLLLESLAQVGAVFIHFSSPEKNKLAMLMNIKEAKFRKPVRPGDVLDLTCNLLHFSSKGGRVLARALIGGEVTAAEAEISYVLVDGKKI